MFDLRWFAGVNYGTPRFYSELVRDGLKDWGVLRLGYVYFIKNIKKY